MPVQKRLWNLSWAFFNKGHSLISRIVLWALLEGDIGLSDLVNSSATPGSRSSVSSIMGEKQQ